LLLLLLLLLLLRFVRLLVPAASKFGQAAGLAAKDVRPALAHRASAIHAVWILIGHIAPWKK